MANGMSLRTVVWRMVMGATMAATPTMSNVLKILLPTTLPTARSGVPLMADIRLTKNSGIDVPMATTVRPITIWGMPMRSANATEPSVSLSAPHNTTATPATSSNACSHTFEGTRANNVRLFIITVFVWL